VGRRLFGRTILALGGAIALLGVLHAQRPFREYPGTEYSVGEIPLPSDWNQPAEFTFARMMFPGGGPRIDGYYPRYQGDYRLGLSLWTQDYPRADRHFAAAVRRLTRIDTRSVEQVIHVEEGDDVYNWPWLYAVQVGEWGLTPDEGKVLRDYLLRGGFFMADDLHGTFERQVFEESMKLVFPERPIIELDSSDAIFHTAFDLDDRYQIPGQAHLNPGYKNNGVGGHWQAILDDKGRVLVAITANSDVGDSWEYADDPYYPERFSALGIRLGVNYILYSMTH
jgi:hypothetical protein